MKRNDVTLTPTERKLLEYIAHHLYSIADDIVEDIYQGEEKKRSNVDKYLGKLKAKNLIRSRPIDTSLGNISPQYLYLLVNGSRALGIEHKPISKRDFSIETFKRNSIICILKEICEANGWLLYQDNNDCRYALVDYLKYFDKEVGNYILGDQAYLDLLPNKVFPDMVLAKPGEYVIVILSDIKAGIAEFNKRITKYKEVLSKVRMITINMNEAQRSEWLTILRNQQPQYYNYSLVQSAKGFFILTYDELEEIKPYLAISTI